MSRTPIDMWSNMNGFSCCNRQASEAVVLVDGTLVWLTFHGLGKFAIFSPCKVQSAPLAFARPCRLTTRSSSERWRPETAGACNSGPYQRAHNRNVHPLGGIKWS